ncbi:MAG: hypothetical protein ABIA74_04345 [bacterium]
MKKYLLFYVLFVSILGCQAVDVELERKAELLADDVLIATCSNMTINFDDLEFLEKVSEDELKNEEFVSLFEVKLAALKKETEDENELTSYVEFLAKKEAQCFIGLNKDELREQLEVFRKQINDLFDSKIDKNKENRKEIESKINEVKKNIKGEDKEALFNFENVQKIYKRYLIEKIIKDLIEQELRNITKVSTE